jgi:hypothetical protein
MKEVLELGHQESALLEFIVSGLEGRSPQHPKGPVSLAGPPSDPTSPPQSVK